MACIKLVTTGVEIARCVDIYLNIAEPFMDIDRSVSIANLTTAVKLKKFMAVKYIGNEIQAWLFADRVKLIHTNSTNFQQFYYASKNTGVKAVRDVIDMHEYFYSNAPRDCKYVVSPGSPFDEKNTFTRILESRGWTRRGHTAYRVAHAGPETARVGVVTPG